MTTVAILGVGLTILSLVVISMCGMVHEIDRELRKLTRQTMDHKKELAKIEAWLLALEEENTSV